MHTVGDVLKHKAERSLKQRIDEHERALRFILSRVHVATSPRAVLRDIRRRMNVGGRSFENKALRKGVYLLALSIHQEHRDEFTRVTGHPVFDRKHIRPPEPSKKARQKNECAKTRKQSDPYEIWQSFDGSWEWRVLKKWQIDDDKPAARWFCAVKSPFTYGSYELGDVYVHEIKSHARRVDDKPGFNIHKYGARSI